MSSDRPTDPDFGDPFIPPPGATPTTPPAPDLVEAIREIIRSELGALAKHWGESHVALKEFAERVEEKADNAIREGKERDKRAADRERRNFDRYMSLHASINEVREHLQMPPYQPPEEEGGRRSFHDLQTEEERADGDG